MIMTQERAQSEMMTMISDGVDRAKAGEALAVYQAIANAGSPIPIKSHYALGWIIYYAMHQSDDREIESRKLLLMRYLALSTPRPHKLHSMILNEAIRLRDNVIKMSYPRQVEEETSSFSIVRFMPHWNFANLRPGDWRRHQLGDKTLSSTVEKLITLYVGELEKGTNVPSEEFLTVIDRALTEYPDNFNLLSQRAVLFARAGETERAVELLKKSIIMAPGKFHLWSRLASLIDVQTNPRLKMAFLARSLTAPGKAEFKGRIHLDLASIWMAQGLPEQAAWELGIVKRTYEAQQWHLPKAYSQIAERIPADTTPVDPSPTYAKLISMAEQEIYYALTPIHTTKTYHKEPQAGPDAARFRRAPEPAWRVTTAEGQNFWMQPLRFGINAQLPHGTAVTIRVHNGKVVHARLTRDL